MVSDLIANEVSGGSDSRTPLQLAVPTRTESGQFPKGTSGNPAGRPRGRKGEIVALKQDLEIAIRSRVDARKIGKIVDKLVNKAMNGNLQAAKLILDKFVSNAGETEDEQAHKGGIRIVIENATFAATKAATAKPAIPGESTEVPQ
jgi:hypothetical protein